MNLWGGGASSLELLGLWWGRNVDESVFDELVVELVSAAFRSLIQDTPAMFNKQSNDAKLLD